MTAHQAAQAWQQRQATALKRAYAQAFEAGQRNYQAQHATPPVAATTTAPTATTQAQAMTRALTPALSSLARMAAQIALLVPTAAQIAAAGTAAAATALLVREYLRASAYLLAGAISILWAAEQAGYAFAAAEDGQLLDWELDPNPTVEHCEDCPPLASLPPMPLSMWPTLPGQGQTACSVGCKCSMRAVAGEVPALTPDQQQLLARIANQGRVLVAA